jgi:phosphotransferase system IIB component
VSKLKFFVINLALVDWLNENYWWPVILFLVALVVIVKLVVMQPKVKKQVTTVDKSEVVIAFLGGIANINKASLDGNRIKFQVKDIDIVKLEGFKDLGASGIFISGNNVKMVLPFSAQMTVDKINSNIIGGKL